MKAEHTARFIYIITININLLCYQTKFAIKLVSLCLFCDNFVCPAVINLPQRKYKEGAKDRKVDLINYSMLCY